MDDSEAGRWVHSETGEVRDYEEYMDVEYPGYACQGCGAIRGPLRLDGDGVCISDPTVAPRRVMLNEAPEVCCEACHEDAVETAVYLAERAAGWDPNP